MATSRHSCNDTARSIAAHLLAGLALALLALRHLPAGAHESDQYTLPVGREFADLGPHITRIVYQAIVEAVNGTNTAIKHSLQDGRPTARTSRLQAPDVIANKVWLQLFAAFPTNEAFDAALAGERMRAKYPGLITAYRPEQSIYDDPLLLLDLTKVIRATFRATTISVDGTVFGTDKIIHFLHLGRAYHSNYLSARKRGLGEKEAVSRAFPDANNLILSENWLLGMATTGIRSNADLAADYAGFKFYRNLTEEVRIGDRVLAPMLVRRGPYWQLNDPVRPDADFFTAFITPHWNEALNPNAYDVLTNARLRDLLRARCPDVLGWYRDEHGRALNREQFSDIEKALSTLYGEDYRYESGGKNAVSIATTCFPAAQPSNADRVSGVVAHADLTAHNPVAPQTGSTQEVRAKYSARARSETQARDPFGRTQLWWAAKDGRLEEVERLIAGGEDPNAGDIDGEGPLHAAARGGRVAVVEVLLAHEADPSMKALYGMTALHVAVAAGQVGVTRALLTHGADANTCDLFGQSPLHNAVSRGDRELVALLLDYRANPGAVDDNGTTPLHLAARDGNGVLVGALLSFGANPMAANSAGATPYDEARRRGHKVIAQQLANAGQTRLKEATGAARPVDRK